MQPTKTPRGLRAPFENNPTYVGEENKMSEEEEKSDLFKEKEEPESADPEEGYGAPPEQQQNLDNQEEEDIKFEEPSVSHEELQKMAREKVMDAEVTRLLSKYIPGLNNQETAEVTTDIEQLKKDADHLGLRLLEAKNITKMDKDEREAYKKKLDRKCSRYDFYKNFIGINPYSIQLRWRLRKARQVKSRLERNIEIFDKELNGNGYISRGSSLYREVLENLPEAMRENKEISSVVEFLSERNQKRYNQQGGLNALKTDLKEKGRTYKAVRQLARNSVSKYKGKIGKTQKKIEKLNKATRETKDIEQQQKMIKENMGLTGQLCVYERERDKWSSLYEFVTDDVLGIKAEYDLTSMQIALRKTTIDTTREALRELNLTVKTLENYVKAKRDMVIMGDHIVDVRYAKDLSQALGLAGYAMNEAAIQMLNGTIGAMKQGIRAPLGEISRQRMGKLQSEVESYKEEQANKFEEMLEHAFEN